MTKTSLNGMTWTKVDDTDIDQITDHIIKRLGTGTAKENNALRKKLRKERRLAHTSS